MRTRSKRLEDGSVVVAAVVALILVAGFITSLIRIGSDPLPTLLPGEQGAAGGTTNPSKSHQTLEISTPAIWANDSRPEAQSQAPVVPLQRMAAGSKDTVSSARGRTGRHHVFGDMPAILTLGKLCDRRYGQQQKVEHNHTSERACKHTSKRTCNYPSNSRSAYEARTGEVNRKSTSLQYGQPSGPRADKRIDQSEDDYWAGHPQVYSAGDSVYVVWSDSRTAPKKDIYLNLSRDRGETWLAEDIRIDTGDNSPMGAHWSDEPQITGAGSNVYVVWTDSRTGGKRIFFNCSFDEGRTWQPQSIQLDSTFLGAQSQVGTPQITCSGKDVHVVWKAKRAGDNEDIYFNRSTDGGLTWLATDLRIDTGSGFGPGEHSALEPQIACSGHRVFVVWTDSRNGSDDIYFSRSQDRGLTWLAEPMRLDTGAAQGTSWSAGPRIAADNDAVYVVYMDGRGDDNGIYFNRSRNGGQTWLQSDLKVDTAPAGAWSGYPEISVSHNRVYVAFKDNRDGEHDIRFNRSLDYGNPATWLASDIRLDVGTEPGTCWSGQHRIGSHGDMVCVVWADNCHGEHSIHWNRSLDAGSSWLLSQDVRLDVAADGLESWSGFPQLCLTDSDVHVVWEDSRLGGSHNIHYGKPLGWSPYGSGFSPLGDRVPTLSGTGFPAPGEDVSLEIGNVANGEGMLVVSMVGRGSELLSGGGVLLVGSAYQTIPITLQRQDNTYRLHIPESASVLGVRACFQVLQRDSHGRVSLSNGLEMVIQ